MIEAAVVDANVAIKWVLPEPGSDRAQSLRTARLEAPDLLLIECASVLGKKVHLGELTESRALAALETLRRAPVIVSGCDELLEAALRLSFDLRHPVYDCLYLALALKRGLPLVTADERLARVARKNRKAGACVLRLEDLPD